MKLNKLGIDLMHFFEGCKLEAYECSGSLPLPKDKKFFTIGYGNTFYENGTPVRQGDKITQDRANSLFVFVANKFADEIKKLIKTNLSENQFSALVCFAYNVGTGNLAKSTLLKKVNANPNDATIANEFLRWNKAGGKELLGLTRRRTAESKLYFTS
jgi:lysozyme